MTKQPPPDTPKALDAIADVVLAYKPKPKSEAAKRRGKSLDKPKKIKQEKRTKNDKPN